MLTLSSEKIDKLAAELKGVHLGLQQVLAEHDTAKSETIQEKCLNAVYMTDPAADREALVVLKGIRAPNTCEWIPDTATYKSWMDSSSPILWISGGPGMGKTMISIYLTKLLEEASASANLNGDLTTFFSVTAKTTAATHQPP